MQFLISWWDSLLVFKPGNARLFALVTLNAFTCLYRAAYLYCVPLMLGLMISMVFTGTRWFLLPFILLLIYLFILYVAARASTWRKDGSYFLAYGKHLVWFSLFFVMWLVMLCSLSLLGIPCWFAQLPLYAPLFPFFSLTIAFLCDSDGSFRAAMGSIYRGFLFVAYNLPVCIIFCAFFMVIAHLLFMLLPVMIAQIFLILLWPLVICTYINLYIKRVHEQFNLYFGSHE
jgi:hypothetical protein